MSPEQLNELFDEMGNVVDGHQATINWINRIQEGKEKRCATFTTRHFICSSKGSTSRCESSMTKIKSGGTMKEEMRHWYLGELQYRHRQMEEGYEIDAR